MKKAGFSVPRISREVLNWRECSKQKERRKKGLFARRRTTRYYSALLATVQSSMIHRVNADDAVSSTRLQPSWMNFMTYSASCRDSPSRRPMPVPPSSCSTCSWPSMLASATVRSIAATPPCRPASDLNVSHVNHPQRLYVVSPQ